MIITPESTTRELVIESSSESRMIQVPECTQSHGGCSGNSGSNNNGGLVVIGGLERERGGGGTFGLCEKKVVSSPTSNSVVYSSNQVQNHHHHHDQFGSGVKDIVVTSNNDKFHLQPSTDKSSTQLKKDEDLNLGKCSRNQ